MCETSKPTGQCCGFRAFFLGIETVDFACDDPIRLCRLAPRRAVRSLIGGAWPRSGRIFERQRRSSAIGAHHRCSSKALIAHAIPYYSWYADVDAFKESHRRSFVCVVRVRAEFRRME